MEGEGGGFLNFVPEEGLTADGQINRSRFPFKHKTLGKNFYTDKISISIENNETSPHKYFLTYAVLKGSEVINPKDVIKYQYKDEDGNLITVNLEEIGDPVDIPIDAIKLEAQEWHDPEGILEREEEFDFYAYEVVLPSAKVLDFSTMEEEEIETYEMDGYKDGDLVPARRCCSLYTTTEKGEYGEFGTWVLGSFGGGSGTSGDPYIINTWTHLDDVRNYLSSSFELANDLTTSDADYLTFNDPATDGWLPIGDSDKFTGTFDGRGYTISDLYINRSSTDYVGLFGWVDASGEVRNVGLVDVDVSGDRWVGGLVGRNSGTVEKSYATGNVSGDSSVGGLVGWKNGTVENSYATGTVTRTSGTNTDFGGFVGRNFRGKIINCYSTGSVHYEDEDDPTDKGFAGSVDTGGDYAMFGNFWNTETSGQSSTSGEATGLTTAEMTDHENNYPEMDDGAGNDFASSPWKDPPVDWNEDQLGNAGYPALEWQTSSTPQVILTVNITGNGTLTDHESTVFNNGDTKEYTEGTTVTLTPNPDADWLFKEWSGDISGKEDPKSFDINADMGATATFFLSVTRKKLSGKSMRWLNF